MALVRPCHNAVVSRVCLEAWRECFNVDVKARGSEGTNAETTPMPAPPAYRVRVQCDLSDHTLYKHLKRQSNRVTTLHLLPTRAVQQQIAHHARPRRRALRDLPNHRT